MSERDQEDREREEDPKASDEARNASSGEHARDAAADPERGADEGKAAATAEAPPPDDARGSPAMGILLFIVFLGGGFFLGKWWIARDTASEIQAEAGERLRVALRGDEPQLGPDDALVTIVEFSDYQCPYCARANGPVKKAVETYAGDVRLIYKHYPLPGHPKAEPAARAAWAAHQQGKFWELHDYLFEAKADTSRVVEQAQRLGLDVEKFQADMAGAGAAQAVDDDFKAGALLRLRGTPAFVVNGTVYSGALTEAQWHEIIDVERSRAKALVDAGTPRSEVYAKLMEGALERRANPAAPDDPVENAVMAVPLDGRPARGPEDALVTLVEFSDFQCPYCSRVAPQLEALVDQNDDVRLVFRNLPLPMHNRAREAAKAALAADRQGKFWEMHDALFARQPALGRANLAEIAGELGLDVEKFEADMQDVALDEAIEEDMALAQKLGVRSTPTTFVNGRLVRGAIAPADMQVIVAEAREQAQKLVDAGTPRERVYDAIIAEAAKGR